MNAVVLSAASPLFPISNRCSCRWFSQPATNDNRMKKSILIPTLIGLACFAAYLPILNNGFIADDFVKLNMVELLKVNPGYTLQTPPEIFRSTSDIVFILLKTCFGYRSGFFYAFSIA